MLLIVLSINAIQHFDGISPTYTRGLGYKVCDQQGLEGNFATIFASQSGICCMVGWQQER